MPEPLFSTVAEQWLNDKTNEFAGSTMTRIPIQFRLYLIPKLGKLPISSINEKILEDYMQELLAGGMAPSTANSLMSLVKTILTYHGYDMKVPVLTIKKGAIRVLSKEEQADLTQYLLDDLSYANIGMLLSLYTGLHLGEVAALKWDNINLEEHLIHPTHTMLRVSSDCADDTALESKTKSAPKTAVILQPLGSDCFVRDIPIPSRLYSILERIVPVPKHGKFLLTGREIHLDSKTLVLKYKKAAKACCIPDTSFMDLRDTFAVRCIALGFNLLALTEILGLADVRLTVERYGIKTSLEQKRKEMEKLSRLF